MSISRPVTGSDFKWLIKTIITIITKKVMVILSKNGIGEIIPSVISGRNFNKVESGIVIRAPHKAAVLVVRFQKNPIKKMANTPGEINPTYS